MSSKWIADHDKADRLLAEIMSSIQKYENLKSQGLSTSKTSATIRKDFSNLKKLSSILNRDLTEIERDPDSYRLTKGEVSRRRNILESLLSRINKTQNDFENQGKLLNFQNTRPNTYQDDTDGMTNRDIMGAQTSLLNKQEQQLGTLLDSIHTQKEVGKAISDELDEQSKLIDDIDEGVSHTDHRIRKETWRSKKLLERTSSKMLIGIVCVLLIVLILLASSDWGKKL